MWPAFRRLLADVLSVHEINLGEVALEASPEFRNAGKIPFLLKNVLWFFILHLR